MTPLTLTWIALPFLAGFIIYMFPRLDRVLALGVAIASIAYSLFLFTQPPLTLNLLDSFSVTLLIDSLSGFFILTNALVTTAVIIYCWNQGKSAFFYMQLIILYGSVNAAFASVDFISLYVALEVSGIAAFLLIAYPRSDRTIWVGLRYLFTSNIAMLFYLVGAALVYQASHSFAFTGLRLAPPEALALIFLGLLVKGGIFVSGLWLPLTHAEAESPVSAMLSGVVVKAGVLPLVRCALLVEELDPVIRIFGVGTAILGVSYAMFEKDVKRMLAFSTVSQLGFILAAPEVGGFYALSHGLVKSSLFLTAGKLPSRDFKILHEQPIIRPLWIALTLASFSISGFPMLSGFGAKVLTMKSLLPWQVVGMNIAAFGTALTFAKLIFLPHRSQSSPVPSPVPSPVSSPVPTINVANVEHQPSQSLEQAPIPPNFWISVGLLIGGLAVANVVYTEAYSLANMVKPIATIALGWLAYWLIFRRTGVAKVIKLPRILEQFDHLIGMMSVMLILLFWMVLA